MNRNQLHCNNYNHMVSKLKHLKDYDLQSPIILYIKTPIRMEWKETHIWFFIEQFTYWLSLNSTANGNQSIVDWDALQDMMNKVNHYYLLDESQTWREMEINVIYCNGWEWSETVVDILSGQKLQGIWDLETQEKNSRLVLMFLFIGQRFLFILMWRGRRIITLFKDKADQWPGINHCAANGTG